MKNQKIVLCALSDVLLDSQLDSQGWRNMTESNPPHDFKSLLVKYKVDKTRVLINGLGSGETQGLIIEVHNDFIDYELLEVKKLKGSEKEKTIREVKHIPIHNIFEISEGEKETETSNGLKGFI